MKRWIAMLILCVAGVARAAPPPSFEAVIDRYEAALRSENVVGGAVALFDAKGIVAERDYGLADRTVKRKVDPATLFHWASVTKVFTSIAAMQLVERNKLSLDDPVVRYIPALRQIHDPFGAVDAITIRHLLTHASGLRAQTWPWNADGGADRAPWQPLEPTAWSQIEAMFPYTAVEFAPGSKASYSNLGMSLLGRVIEIVSGDDIEVYINKNILMPLGMRQTYFDATPWYLRPHRTHGYTADRDAITDHGSELDTGATHANGGLNGPLSDLAKLSAFLLGAPDAYPILKRETLRAMLEPQLPFEKDARRTVWIGLGFFVADETDAHGTTRRYFGHSGFQRGHRSSLYLAMDGSGGFLFAANTNTRGGNPSAASLRAAMVDEVLPGLRTAGEGR